MSNRDIISAAKRGDLESVVSCLNCGVSVNERDKDNATPLYWSCCRGYTKLSAELIKWNPDINAKVKWGSTALHASCDRGHIACATLLIDNGADLDIKNKTENTALHLSAYRGNIDIVKLLVQRGANVFLRNDKGRCASEEAETGNHTLTAQFLYKKMKEYENKFWESEKTIHSCPENFGKKIAETHSEISEREYCLSANSEYFISKGHPYVERSRSCGEIDIKRECLRDINLLRIETKEVEDDTVNKESLLSLSEKLQQQVLKANEEIVEKDKKIRELSATNAEMSTELSKYKTICQRLSEQKSALEEKLNIYDTCSSSEDFMFEFLKEVTQLHPSCSFSDEYFKHLKSKVRNKMVVSPSVMLDDTPMKEWFPGTDYVVNGDRPIKTENTSIESLTFLIRHLKSGKFCDLQMKLFDQDSAGYISPQERAANTQELKIISGLHHPNLMKSIHSYFGTTERFRRFLSVIVPQPRGFTNSVNIPKQALFIVTEHYSHTLESFITAQKGMSPVPLYGLSNDFFLTLVYQILSGICYLRRFGIVHRNLQPGSIYLTDRFCPVIGNLELAIRGFDNDGKKLELTDTCQILAGNSNAWSPELLQSKGDEHYLISQKVSLISIYEKSDVYAVGRMFYTILLPSDVDRKFQETIKRYTGYTAQEIPDLPMQLSRGLKVLLKSLVGSNPSERLDEQTARLFVGVLLFAPKVKKLSSIEDVRMFCHARLLSLLGKDRRICTSSKATVIIEEIQKVICAELESDFFTGVTDIVFFHMYNKLCALDLLE